jgi:predicted aldo/keto reductase-like oxidoreductase
MRYAIRTVFLKPDTLHPTGGIHSMEYRDFGKTGIKISRLGFGAMRLPMVEVKGKMMVDEEKAIAMIHHAFEMGVNYIDTALFYNDGLSEFTVGKALKGWRDKVYLSTKYPFDDGFRPTLEKQLKKLDVDYIDFYHFHGIGQWFHQHKLHDEASEGAAKAKAEGLIRHLSFSFHGKAEEIPGLLDTGLFESVLCQYNLVDRSNEAMLAEAKRRGLGTVVMGPIGGGRIAGMSKDTATRLGIKIVSNAELALRFVFANPNIDCAISGMETLAQVEENVAIASNMAPLSPAEVAGINAAMDENQRLAELYCTGCNYCMPYCSQEVNIPYIFKAMNNHRIYRTVEYAQGQYNEIGASPWVKGRKADACIDCGLCEEHCPQKIKIREQLKECLKIFAG